MMWQPEITVAAKTLNIALGIKAPFGFYEDIVRTSLETSGALSEINRLTALLAMKDETINTLRTQLHKATATFVDDYDSGYRAA